MASRPAPSSAPLSGMRRRGVVLGSAGAGLGGGIVTSLAEGKLMEISFAPSAESGLPPGVSIARTGQGAQAAWTTLADPSAPGGVLAQTSTDQTDYRFPLAIYDRIFGADLDVNVRFMPVAGCIDRAGGIAVRLTDADNYYVVRANALEDNVNFYRVVQGSRRQIQGTSVRVASGAWHTLGLKAEGESFTIAFDGKVLFTATDPTFPGAGKVALWTKADSVTHFSDLTILTRS
jgi:hypothetical protein